MADKAPTFKVEGAQLKFRNFTGTPGKFNIEGDRSFVVELDPEVAEQMLADGWNVRYLDAREEGDEPTPIIRIAVGYKFRPPRIVMMTDRARVNLGEDEVEVLDWANIANADLIARGADWTVNGKSGIKAWLQTLFVQIEEDDLEKKYAINEMGEDE